MRYRPGSTEDQKTCLLTGKAHAIDFTTGFFHPVIAGVGIIIIIIAVDINIGVEADDKNVFGGELAFGWR